MDETRRIAFFVSLVAELAKGGRVGKTHIQKATYFAQEAALLELGFRYVIHHYGPFSFELDSFLQGLASQGTLTIKPEEDGYGYAVSVAQPHPDVPHDEGLKRDAELLGGYFGGLNTRELELLSISYYVQQKLPKDEQDTWIQEVKNLKPRFTDGEIGKALTESRAIADDIRKQSEPSE